MAIYKKSYYLRVSLDKKKKFKYSEGKVAFSTSKIGLRLHQWLEEKNPSSDENLKKIQTPLLAKQSLGELSDSKTKYYLFIFFLFFYTVNRSKLNSANSSMQTYSDLCVSENTSLERICDTVKPKGINDTPCSWIKILLKSRIMNSELVGQNYCSSPPGGSPPPGRSVIATFVVLLDC